MTTRNAVLLAIAAGHARDLRAVLDNRIQLPAPQPPDLRLLSDAEQAQAKAAYLTAMSSTSKTRV